MVPTQSVLAFRIPASAVRAELWRGDHQWSLAYLGLTSMGLEVVDDALVDPGVEGADVGVVELVEGRLRALGRCPMRIRCDSAPPMVAAWKV